MAVFLGIFLDPKLEGKEHLKYLVQKDRAIMNILSNLAGTKWGLHPHNTVQHIQGYLSISDRVWLSNLQT